MNEFDVWQKALRKINLNEATSFVSRGKLITETSQVETYNKIQALLNANDMECCHKYLYNLDPAELSESDASKVNNLYKLGIERGFIQGDDNEEDEQLTQDQVV